MVGMELMGYCLTGFSSFATGSLEKNQSELACVS